MGHTVRKIRFDELQKLTGLYQYLNPDDARPFGPPAEKVWSDIFKNEDRFIYLAVEADGKLASSCAITIIPNLTRGARPYAVIENVVTHPDYRRKGLGREVIDEAVRCAEKAGCYKVMLLSSADRQEAHRFYESLGFSSKEKKGFVKKL